jgi:hypothetical protein
MAVGLSESPRADLRQLRRLFIDADRDSAPQQRECRCKPADAGADDPDLEINHAP